MNYELKETLEAVIIAFGVVLSLIIFVILFITIPVWIIPYLIYKKVKK